MSSYQSKTAARTIPGIIDADNTARNKQALLSLLGRGTKQLNRPVSCIICSMNNDRPIGSIVIDADEYQQARAEIKPRPVEAVIIAD